MISIYQDRLHMLSVRSHDMRYDLTIMSMVIPCFQRSHDRDMLRTLIVIRTSKDVMIIKCLKL